MTFAGRPLPSCEPFRLVHEPAAPPLSFSRICVSLMPSEGEGVRMYEVRKTVFAVWGAVAIRQARYPPPAPPRIGFVPLLSKADHVPPPSVERKKPKAPQVSTVKLGPAPLTFTSQYRLALGEKGSTLVQVPPELVLSTRPQSAATRTVMLPGVPAPKAI